MLDVFEVERMAVHLQMPMNDVIVLSGVILFHKDSFRH